MRTIISESSIQCAYLKWLNLQHPEVFSVTSSFPNGGVREPRYGARLKREGMKKGFPDLGIFIPCREYHGMFIEFKNEKGRVSPEQKEILYKLEAKGYHCVICKSIDEAINKTNEYLKN
jgi:hypothetical protein